MPTQTLADIVGELEKQHHASEQPQTSSDSDAQDLNNHVQGDEQKELFTSHSNGGVPNGAERALRSPRRPSYYTQMSTPSARTGPPRSLSFSYASTPYMPRIDTHTQNCAEDIPEHGDQAAGYFESASSFRGVLDMHPMDSPDTWDRKWKKHDCKHTEDSSRRWFHDSPQEETSNAGFHHGKDESKDKGKGKAKQEDIKDSERTTNGDAISPTMGDEQQSPDNTRTPLHRSNTTPHSKSRPAVARWGRLRSMLPHVMHHGWSSQKASLPSAVASQTVNITDELMVGGLDMLMLRLWFERDEKDMRRAPILFHRLRVRVSDSLHPMHGTQAVFRIECEYANGAARWVIYRQLRDFVSLHTHYKFSNAYFRNVENLPEFPRTSLPYFKFLKKESREKGSHIGPAEFARMQRAALENYLIDLIRAVMFHPASNRLAGFLEVSALSIALAQSGGAQYKAGYLRLKVESTKGGGFGRKSAGRKEKRQYRWCAVRESYLVVVEEPGELQVWDVFLIDSDFKIERPKRAYRQGINLLHHPDWVHRDKDSMATSMHDKMPTTNSAVIDGGEHKSFLGTVTSRILKIFHLGAPEHERAQSQTIGDLTRTSSRFSAESGSATPTSTHPGMLDPSTNTNPAEARPEQNQHAAEESGKQSGNEDVSKHTFYIENSQMRLKLFARNERQMLQWITGLEKVAASSHYTGRNRFDSFAPIRLNVAAQWLVDGRDYFWNLSRAISLARDTIYIHDWWLSPELFLRRPNKDKYRLDKLLARKAAEGVKIYIILYLEVSSRTTPTDSSYAKQRLTSLHPNIMVQRSPSHFQTGTFYWAHHEKLCVIDSAIAFMGGLDLCFGRWDTPQHVLIDDPDFGSPEIWPGKDYSNPRIHDFYNLPKPDEDMYDRTKVPRMPWHDVALQVVGQPARDIARHFTERWNYLLRIKNHTRIMPFLLPPPEFKAGELAEMGLTGTCEFQICRSAGPWSLGTPSRIEHSIENAYLKAIQLSEHFVYIENQFFITSTTVNEVKVENRIGDAIVHRIIRAHREGTPWKCCILIPLIPGFSFPVDHSDASAVRIIMECQNRTLFRGPESIFSKLRKEGIDPDDYISIFALRNWGKLRGDVLTTEQVYIHAKICIVDDRLAIIGSANVNERSQRGDRDSEIAAVIRDTDLIDCTMAGKPYKVGRFAHTLRVRLMREHLGIDVDAMDEDDLMANEPVKREDEQDEWDPDTEQEHGMEEGVIRITKKQQKTPAGAMIHDGLDSLQQAIHASTDAGSKSAGHALRKVGIKSSQLDATAGDKALHEERTMYTQEGKRVEGFASALVPTLEEKVIAEHRPPSAQAEDEDAPIATRIADADNSADGDSDDLSAARTVEGELFGAPAQANPSSKKDEQPPRPRSHTNDVNEEDQAAVGARSLLRKHIAAKFGSKWTLPTPTPKVDPDGFEDPICDEFWKNVWISCAVHNTEIYRKVFHAVPDDLITTWKQYREFVVHHERLNKPVKEDSNTPAVGRVPSETADIDAIGQRKQNIAQPTQAAEAAQERDIKESRGERLSNGSADNRATAPVPQENGANGHPAEKDPKSSQRRPAGRGPEPFERWERDEMEKLLGELCGHLVVYPSRFLEGEDIANNFLFNADRLLPMPIYD